MAVGAIEIRLPKDNSGAASHVEAERSRGVSAVGGDHWSSPENMV
jgi:hypothetical protein